MAMQYKHNRQYSKIQSRATHMLLSAVCLFTVACANTASITTPNTVEKTTDFSSQNEYFNQNLSQNINQRVSGKLLDIDGKTPVSGATIYIANHSAKQKRMLNGLSLSNTVTASAPCKKPVEAYYAYTCSRADGSFELVINEVNQLPLPLTFSKDDKTIEIKLELNDFGSDIGMVAFDIPEIEKERVAVIVDFYNPYEDISNQMKINTINPIIAFSDIAAQLTEALEIDVEKSKVNFPQFEALFEDKDGDNEIDLFQYNTIYINSRDSADLAQLDKEKKKHLLKYISLGGQLYMTEWTFELPEIPLDQYI